MSNKTSSIEQIHSGAGHNIARDLNIYNYGNSDFSTDIAISMLVGSWDESKEDDISTLEFLTNEKYSDWIIKIRKIEASDNNPFKHDSGIWLVKNRADLWGSFSSRLYKDHLDKFKEISIKILSTLDPKFDLKPEERFCASVYGKILPHSPSIRNGLAEGLALISTGKESLVNCSSNYGEYIANAVVKEVFDSSNWMLWASTQDIQPVMGEAAPSEFLDAVENAVIHEDKPFNTLFSQEGGGGITGANYMTGLLWGLESLAWSPLYLTRCVVLLGEMDSYDPGGNWTNRPGNSISDILLPWLPHTTATFERRLASLKALEREFPATAWKVLLNLLPSSHGMTSGTSTPKWRKFIPENFKKEVTHKEYNEQVIEFGNYVVELSKKDNSRLPKLVEHLDHLHDAAFTASVQVLIEYSKSETNAEAKHILWTELLSFINKHKKFADADWTLPSEKLNQLNPVVANLRPVDKSLLYQRLFTHNTMALFEEKGSWREQEEAIKKEREKAISELFEEGGYELIFHFSQTVESSNIVGSSLASIVEIDDEGLLLEYLKSDEVKTKQYISGYIWTRNFLTKGQFLDSIKLDSWGEVDASKILLILPFDIKTWNKVDDVLGQNFEHLYWLNVIANAYHCDDEDGLYRGIDLLLKHDRPLSSIHCIYRLLHSKKTLRLDQTVKSLLGAVKTKESSTNMDSYEIGEIIEFLQTSDQLSDDDRFRIEWAYLPLISRKTNENSSPKYLEGRLSKDPDFFCEIVRLAYKSDKAVSNEELSDSQKNIARNAYDLLDEWKKIAGSKEDGVFEPSEFENWFSNVVEISKESGHLSPALRVIGKNLINSPAGDNGAWIHPALAEFLNQREFDDVRDSYRLAVYNSRGVHVIDPEAKPEIELSEVYQSKSEAMDLLGFQRFARTLREISESYSLEAEGIVKRFTNTSELTD